MPSLFPRHIKKRLLAVCLTISIAGTLLFTGCSQKSGANQNKTFQSFTNEVFCQEVSSNSISLHYSLKDPEKYGIREAPVTFGSFSADSKAAAASYENLKAALNQFSYDSLSVENQLTYDVLDYYLQMAQKNANYLLYEEPLGLVSGIQTQLPVLLSEYQFYSEEDIDTYLELMQTTPDYFDSLIAFEKEKSKAGLFMADYAADTVIAQCTAFMEMGESNYLISTFVDRLKELNISSAQQSSYIKKNAQMLQSYVLPAYSRLVSAVQSLKGTGKNEEGLCHLPDGKNYYEQIVEEATGSGRTVPELEDLTRRQIISDLEAMEEVLQIAGNEAKETAAMEDNNPVTILNELESKTGKSFPEPPETVTQVKYVPKAMEEHLSPAFYMIPAIDNTKENVIYVNQSQMSNNLTLYTTLAHEGYPGHLYQTVYYAGTDPDPLRSIFNFGGYVEGWATYAEMCSYYLSSLSKEQATLLQKNSSIILGLYALADMGIHYEGWSKIDTIAFFKNYGIKDSKVIERIYELIIGSPGNYLKYYIGYVEFLELKKEWAKQKGNDFSQKEFHEAVLSVGPAPFTLVEEYMGKLTNH
ncbi:DUF885 domain-containing protein [Faecalicatena orotica]|uniref:Uncharacterized protein (DUF885 family) n=1 Tax=Faecalicatena orotica TaxID=1544 RepID=A0A2Y9BKU8_9FIRM|nr:DUF885 domain-containing protein [Faecalicatena orotica]PWJ19444.1 uncharacterized protein (DUF885 family) [Faecalicatena orotica]SSA58657.1 Uncharacterized conserved protein, DUF885 familyt [Faecalicatena orotica]